MGPRSHGTHDLSVTAWPTVADPGQQRNAAAASGVAERRADRLDQGVFVEGLAKILGVGGRAGSVASGLVVARRDEHDGEGRLHVGKALLHVEAAESRQVNVEDQALDRPEALPREEFLAGAKGIHREACGAQQPPQGAEDRRIVVDNRDALTQDEHFDAVGGRASARRKRALGSPSRLLVYSWMPTQ